MPAIDLNCDMGEVPESIADGTQEMLMPWLTSVNIACRGHAGDEQTMKATIQQSLRFKLAIGAHPGYPDRRNFGRVELEMAPQAISDTVYEQVRTLARIAAAYSVEIKHVKAHGALYNQAAHRREIAGAIADGIARWNRKVILVGLAGSPMLDVFRDSGFRVAAEAFADRRYEPDGSLRARKFSDALICDPKEASHQALLIAQRGKLAAYNGVEIAVEAQTICIHGDTAGAVRIAEAVAQKLREGSVSLRALSQ